MDVKYCLLLLFVPFISNILAAGVFAVRLKQEQTKSAVMKALADEDNEALDDLLLANQSPLGVTPNFVRYGITPLQRALEKELEMALTLIRYGASLTFTNKSGITPQQELEEGRWPGLAQALQEQRKRQAELDQEMQNHQHTA